MKRNVSPAFAVVVIVFALVVGALYFMQRYRANETLIAQQRAGSTARAMAARSSGRMAEREEQSLARRAARAGRSPGTAARTPGGNAPADK